MVKKFTTNCDFSGTKAPVTFFIGESYAGTHPLAFQSKWLGQEKGGKVPEYIMNSFSKLKDISDRNKVSFEDLCSFVIDEINAKNTIASDVKKAQELSSSVKRSTS